MRKKGSNQYRSKYKKDVGAYMIGFLYLMILMLALHDFSIILKPSNSDASESVNVITSPLADPAKSMAVVAYTPPATPTPNIQEEIEAYIKTIFGRDAKTAIAVSRNECGPTNKSYPSCQFHTSHENSIGLFQINLMSKYAKVHYDRVPGETLEEKIEWLKDPHNNVLMAYWIYSHSGWNPWTAYTSGNYLKDM